MLKDIFNKKKNFNNFDHLSDIWWDKHGSLKLLHDYNVVRVPYIARTIKSHFALPDFDFTNIKVLDIGCGGGILSEAISKLKATLTGIDSSLEATKSANNHALQSGLEIQYSNKKIEELNENNKFDVIMAMEVLEHVDNVDEFIKNTLNLLNTNGILFFSTIKRNLYSLLFAKLTAEYILNVLPRGIHEYKKFINPSELEDILNKYSMYITDLKGVRYNPLTSKFSLATTNKINYIGYALKA